MEKLEWSNFHENCSHFAILMNKTLGQVLCLALLCALISVSSCAGQEDCLDATPIFNNETETCEPCKNSIECMTVDMNLPICDTETGRCGICSTNEECEKDNTQPDTVTLLCNVTSGGCYPICSKELCGDPESQTGLIIAYVVVCVSMLVFLVVFIVFCMYLVKKLVRYIGFLSFFSMLTKERLWPTRR